MKTDTTRLNVFILYEDLAAGLLARTILNRAVYELGSRADAAITVWRFDMLRDRALRRSAVDEAAGATIVILSTRDVGLLPPEVSRWLADWLEARVDSAGCLAVLSSADPTDSDGGEPLLAGLREAARGRNLTLFFHGSGSTIEDAGAATRGAAATRPSYASASPVYLPPK